MNRADRRAHRRSSGGGLPTRWSAGADDLVIRSNPGCDAEDHREMVLSIMLGFGPGETVLAGMPVQWSCGCWFSVG